MEYVWLSLAQKLICILLHISFLKLNLHWMAQEGILYSFFVHPIAVTFIIWIWLYLLNPSLHFVCQGSGIISIFQEIQYFSQVMSQLQWNLLDDILMYFSDCIVSIDLGSEVILLWDTSKWVNNIKVAIELGIVFNWLWDISKWVNDIIFWIELGMFFTQL